MIDPRRQKVLDEAESWLGTPFHHLQCCKGAGVDCGLFIYGVFRELDLVPYVEVPYYPKDFHLHRSDEWYKGFIERFSRKITLEEVLPADVVMYKVGRIFSHGGIIVQWPRIIHSFVSSGVIYADGTQGYMMGRIRSFHRPLMFDEEKIIP